jgi:hypothetical protein
MVPTHSFLHGGYVLRDIAHSFYTGQVIFVQPNLEFRFQMITHFQKLERCQPQISDQFAVCLNINPVKIIVLKIRSPD